MIRWCFLTWALLLLVETQAHIKTLVYGGTAIRYDTHKYLVFIIARDTRSLCSGSIINSMTILTAAHCFNRFSSKFSIKHYNREKFIEIAYVTQYGVIIHPEYDQKLMNRDVDLAVMKTEENIEFDECVQPIPLAHYISVQVSDKAIIAGFGKADPTGRPDGREGKVIVTNCPTKFHNTICTLGFIRAGSGDSGGALIYRRRLVGVTSGSCTYAEQLTISKPCLTVYANVTANIDWILSQLDVLTTTEIPTTTTDDTSLSLSPNRTFIRPKVYDYWPIKKTTSTTQPPINRSGLESLYRHLPIYYDNSMSRTNFLIFLYYKKAVINFSYSKNENS